jgi:threonyl-tRNA synthetase
MRMRQPLINYWQELHDKAGYEEVSTPILLSDSLWKQSGHWQNYKKSMYFTKADNKTYALKPMNCPGMILIYKNRPHSYKELPIKWRELGLVHRHEPSGTLNGLLRERAFRQDDAHIFCREDQIEQLIKEVIQLAISIYNVFHFEYRIELSTRPKKSIGTDEMWEKSEAMLHKALKDLKLNYQINKGDGAFYGPKIDFHIKDSISRFWQCGTIQLDFAMPERFNLTYIDADGKEKKPVMIHRAIFGSVHRFFAILLEHYAGALPLWLSPIQVTLIPIADRHVKHTEMLLEEFRKANIHCEVDSRNETMQAKIRDATLQKVPYIGIIGDKELAGGNALSVRRRNGEDLGQVELSKFINDLKDEISQKK